MESIYKLFSTLFDFTLAGAFLFFIVKMLQFRQSLAAKNELQKLQARVSMLRMALKSKVKKRENSFRVFFAKSINTGDVLDYDLGKMAENKFETSHDFQNYFDLVKKVHANLLLLHAATEISLAKFIEPDQQNELVIIKMIKEMKDASTKFNLKVENYNKLHPKNKIGNLDPMVFGAMGDIEQILKAESDHDDSVVADDQFDAA